MKGMIKIKTRVLLGRRKRVAARAAAIRRARPPAATAGQAHIAAACGAALELWRMPR